MPQISVRVDDDLLARINSACGGVPRERWLRRLIERELEATPSEAKGALQAEQAGPVPVPSQEGVRPAASPPAPDRADLFRQRTQR